ncbi:MAG: glutamate--tRNA ligase [Patescibacteria group bacterium]
MVRTRIAPSPTGEFHIGGLRTLLYNWAYARKNDGKFVIRIEDTDRQRYVEGSEQRLLEVIKDYGLNWDEGPDIGGEYAPYTQSERLAIYKEWAEKLVKEDKAYYCFCTKQRLEEVRKQQIEKKLQPRYDRHCRNLTTQEVAEKLSDNVAFVIRLKVPENEEIRFKDEIRGEIVVDSNTLDDQVLIKSDGFPTYHLGVVIDDILMEITHVMRAEEWLPSTPKHVLLYKAFGYPLPAFIHLTDLLNPDGKGKMSKRYGSVSARGFLDEGYLPAAMLNFLMLLGWAPSNNQEIFSLAEFVEVFDIKGLQVKAAAFDKTKLDWMNSQYIMKMTDEEFAKVAIKFVSQDVSDDLLVQIAPLLKSRINKFSEINEIAGFFFSEPNVDESLFIENYQKHLAIALEIITDLENWNLENLNTKLMDKVKENNFKTGDFFMDLRVAITGKKFTPPINDSIIVLGKEKTVARIKRVLK